MTFKRILYLTIFLFFFISELFPNNNIRILISKTSDKIIIKGDFSLIHNSRLIKSLKDTNFLVSANNNLITIFNRASYSELFLKNNNGYFQLGNYKYKGSLKLVAENNKLLFINVLNVEEYIKGVLPNEISSKWHIEVLKAQAVAARTFAYYYIINNADKDRKYDLTDNTFAQVYKGMVNENAMFNKAINTTKEEVIIYNGKVIQAFFHSVCGGYTEDAGKVWGRDLPFLKAIPCNYCSGARYYKWKAEFTETELLRKLKYNKYYLTGIRSIVPAEKSRSGRWVKVKIIGRKKSIGIPGNKFRIILGIEKLRSTKFVIRKRHNKFIISGKGWGHGVGMCQWGAKNMAEKNYKYYQILRYYYRDSKLKKISSLKNGMNSKYSKPDRPEKTRGPGRKKSTDSLF